MASFEEEFYLENPTRGQVFRRNLRLALRLFRFAWLWLTVGARVRRQYHRAQQSGQPLILEEVTERQ